MNTFAQCCFLVGLLVLLFEIIETGNGYKLIRPYKYYQRRPWSRPRWHADHKSSKLYHSKRISPEDHYSRRPSYNRYGSAGDDFNGRVENHPYTIVIQLPKEEDKHRGDSYGQRKRKFERISVPAYTTGSDYIEDEDEAESKVVNVDNRRVQIKMVKGESPKLHIKISRSDNEKNVEIMDRTNKTGIDSPKIHASFTRPVQQSTVYWTPARYFENPRQKRVLTT
ncbi:uncharacterized protein LOC122532722 [Frieseomelitta varia]|uniref:uncharacterized protein LOC122532722 n=1 Tax=Frieseomelitta varia TaxID=561572 RepID=UPI001CB6AC2F|nr:uncharacterized protein LOC122532722 [Frieseomelitta varia]